MYTYEERVVRLAYGKEISVVSAIKLTVAPQGEPYPVKFIGITAVEEGELVAPLMLQWDSRLFAASPLFDGGQFALYVREGESPSPTGETYYYVVDKS